jgi:hypothetical protein
MVHSLNVVDISTAETKGYQKMREFLSLRARAFGINGIAGGQGLTAVLATAAFLRRFRFS